MVVPLCPVRFSYCYIVFTFAFLFRIKLSVWVKIKLKVVLYELQTVLIYACHTIYCHMIILEDSIIYTMSGEKKSGVFGA